MAANKAFESVGIIVVMGAYYKYNPLGLYLFAFIAYMFKL
jgi:hypothetical protein